MKSDNIILKKTYSFALRIIEFYKTIQNTHREYDLSRQLLRNATSIGANAEEASAAQSKKDFIHKFSISLKEARETHYWLRLLKDSSYLDKKDAEDLLKDCEEIMKILTSIINLQKINYSLKS